MVPHQLDGPGTAYNIPLALRLRGPLDAAALRGGARRRGRPARSRCAPCSRTTAQPYQRIDPGRGGPAVPVTVAAAAPASWPRLVGRRPRHEFDLAAELPVRAWLFTREPGGARAAAAVHHIAGDGWSMPLLMADLAAAYRRARGGPAPDWAPLPVQYADYALWQRDLLGEEPDPDSCWPGSSATGHALAGLPESWRCRPTGRGPPSRPTAAARCRSSSPAAACTRPGRPGARARRDPVHGAAGRRSRRC